MIAPFDLTKQNAKHKPSGLSLTNSQGQQSHRALDFYPTPPPSNDRADGVLAFADATLGELAERGHDGCEFEDERHDVRRCRVHGGFISEDFYSEAHGNGWNGEWDCAHDQGHPCVTHCTVLRAPRGGSVDE